MVFVDPKFILDDFLIFFDFIDAAVTIGQHKTSKQKKDDDLKKVQWGHFQMKVIRNKVSTWRLVSGI